MTTTHRLADLIRQAKALTEALRRSDTLESVQDYGAALAEVLQLAHTVCANEATNREPTP